MRGSKTLGLDFFEQYFRPGLDSFEHYFYNELGIQRPARNVVKGLIQALKKWVAHRFPTLHQAYVRYVKRGLHNDLNRQWVGDLARFDVVGDGYRVPDNIDFLFFPLRGYHVREYVRIQKILEDARILAAAVATDPFRRNYEAQEVADRLGIRLIGFKEFVRSEARIRACVFFNDWDPLMRLISKLCHENEIGTVGFVEGIQDYRDLDTGRKRYPYRRSHVVIVPGEHDLKYFEKSRQQKMYTGYVPRVQELWKERRSATTTVEEGCVLINSNFSYGVLEDHRDLWLKQVVEATLVSGFLPLISRHPFDKGTLFPEYASNDDFYALLKRCCVSVHRFASGILESLAAGTPVVYFNPHSENVDKFSNPRGAYLVALCLDELKTILAERKYSWNEARAGDFLRFHAGLSPSCERENEARIVDIFLNICSRFGTPSSNLQAELKRMDIASNYALRYSELSAIPPFYGDEPVGSATHGRALG